MCCLASLIPLAEKVWKNQPAVILSPSLVILIPQSREKNLRSSLRVNFAKDLRSWFWFKYLRKTAAILRVAQNDRSEAFSRSLCTASLIVFAVLGFCGLIFSLLLLRADRREALPDAAGEQETRTAHRCSCSPRPGRRAQAGNLTPSSQLQVQDNHLCFQ